MINFFGFVMWKIGLFGVEHGMIGRSRIFDYVLRKGGAWAFGRDE